MTSAIVARADAMLSLGRGEEAMRILSASLASEPDSAELLRQMARAQLLSDQAQAARQTAERAVAAEPDSEWGFRILSQACSETGDHWNAVQTASEAQRLAPLEWRTHVRRALASAQAKHLGDALAAAHEAVRLAPQEADAHFAMGYASSANGDYATAERAYLATLAIQPDHATAMNNIGTLRLKQRGGLNKAVHGFGAALAADAQLGVARRNLDVVARRYMRRFHFGVVIAYIVLQVSFPTQALGAPDRVSNASRVHAGLLGAVALVVLLGSIVVLDRRLPANLRPYYRRLPRTDHLLGGWLLLDLAALGVISALAVPTTYSGRSTLAGVAWGLILAGLALSWLPRLLGNRSR